MRNMVPNDTPLISLLVISMETFRPPAQELYFATEKNIAF